MDILYRIIIYPIELILEFFFIFFDKSFDNLGLSIVGLSFVVSLLTLPLYHVAESLQRKERDQRQALAPGIERIKSVFKGDEQYMMLTTFYRQNHYHPLYALRSSISLIIQVPFFIAAYHFLSHMEQLKQTSLFFIPSLGSPDGLLSLGGVAINLLPILMTAINIAAGIIYTKGFPVRDKVQLYAMAALFLVLLYNSPAGLVLYWTLNNLFSLGKNIFYKMKRPLPVLYILSVGATIGLTVVIWILHPTLSLANRLVFITGCLVVVLIPALLYFIKVLDTRVLHRLGEHEQEQRLLFFLSAVLLFLLHGLLVPANLISSSTIEFAFTGAVANPLSYVGSTMAVFFGLWIVWPLFIYALAKGVVKRLLSIIMPFLALSSLVNVFVFAGDYGIVSTLLQLDNPSLLEPSTLMVFAPLGVALLIMIGILIMIKSGKVKILISALLILVLGSSASGGYQSIAIAREFREHEKNLALVEDGSVQGNTIKPVFHLSKTGKNVLFIFIDRAMNSLFPYILEDIPDLQQQLSGFVYYPNTVSFGNNTIHGSPAMVGGYEYTPDAMNARANEKLVDKHNEALLVMPRMFLNAGYSVTMTNPPYSNYKWEADFTPFLPYPEINVMHHHGKFAVTYKNEHTDVLDWNPAFESDLIKKRLPIFSMFKSSFPLLRRTLYEEGRYFQKAENPHSTDTFIDAYAQLYYLQKLTDFVEEGNTFVSISNDTTHQPIFLQVPEYEPRSIVTNTSTPLDTVEGIRSIDRSHYHTNAATLKQLGLYFEYLQDQGVWDNTRIIVVADHGYAMYSDGMKDFGLHRYDYNGYVPLLLMKDFDSTGPVKTDTTFMTNGDAPLFAMKDIIQNPINPFTKKNLYEQVKKDKVNVYTGPWDPRYNTGNIFKHDETLSFSVHDDIFVESNWDDVDEELW